MANFFFTDAKGTKQGPITGSQLKVLVAKGVILPHSQLETDSGHKGLAKQIPGLFDTTPSPFEQVAPATSPVPTKLFCTYCGNTIAEQAVACMSCGAAPVGHKKFCRHCGIGLHPEQVVCVKCGSGIKTTVSSQSFIGGNSKTSWPKNRLMAALFAFLLGGLGAHKFYMGSWGWGAVFIGAVIFSGFLLGIVTCIIAFVEMIQFLLMSDADFAAKYPPETEQPFRW